MAVEPVKLTAPGVRWLTSWAPSGSGPLITFSTPGGSTSLSNRPSSRVASGVYGDGLSTMVLPARSAGPTLASASAMG